MTPKESVHQAVPVDVAKAPPHHCSGLQWSGYHRYVCGRGAKYEHDGKWFCKTHHPPSERARRDKKNAERAESFAWKMRLAAHSQATEDERQRRADLHDSLIDALEKLANEAEAIAEMARPSIGNTNVECLMHRVRIARGLIAKPTATHSSEQSGQEGGS